MCIKFNTKNNINNIKITDFFKISFFSLFICIIGYPDIKSLIIGVFPVFLYVYLKGFIYITKISFNLEKKILCITYSYLFSKIEHNKDFLFNDLKFKVTHIFSKTPFNILKIYYKNKFQLIGIIRRDVFGKDIFKIIEIFKQYIYI